MIVPLIVVALGGAILSYYAIILYRYLRDLWL